MPGGGRGTLLDIAGSLNEPKHTQIAGAIKMALDNGEYRVLASVPMIGAAYSKCENTATLDSLWCHAVATGRVDWGDY